MERSHSGATQVQKMRRSSPESCPYLIRLAKSPHFAPARPLRGTHGSQRRETSQYESVLRRQRVRQCVLLRGGAASYILALTTMTMGVKTMKTAAAILLCLSLSWAPATHGFVQPANVQPRSKSAPTALQATGDSVKDSYDVTIVGSGR